MTISVGNWNIVINDQDNELYIDIDNEYRSCVVPVKVEETETGLSVMVANDEETKAHFSTET